jgi:ABC-type uncharacterized transport system substrate-binding protein
MGTSLEAVEVGLVDSLARPGGNVTGLSLISADLMEKRLALLKKPSLTSRAWLSSPARSASLTKILLYVESLHS